MYAKEVNEHSPLRILEKSIHGGLGKGNLGVVMARAGVGKTAALVQIGLDDLMRDKDVLHVALGQSLEHVQSWYDALFDDLAATTDLQDRDTVRAQMVKHRVIKAYADQDLTPERLERALSMFEQHMSFRPSAILIDGYDWTGGHTMRDPGTSYVPLAQVAADLGELKGIARRLGAELWISAQTHRNETGNHPTGVTPPCAPYVSLIDVAVYLEPHGDHIDIRILKDHDNPGVSDTHLHLHPDTLSIFADGDEPKARMPSAAYTLLSGGAAGAESEFGACAERWGLNEINFSFPGRATDRTRGLVTLSEAELKLGEVSTSYLATHMHRQYPETPLFRRVLQSIWHQVNTAGEVFAIGVIKDDNTVKGGTGWAAELARHQDKTVHVYDQERRGWYRWSGSAWAEEKEPRIQKTRFTGTGTRFLSDDGRAAIRALFERSFGAPR